MAYRKAINLLGSALLLVAAVLPACAQGHKDSTRVYTPMTSIDGYTNMGKQTSDSLTLGASYANAGGHHDQAIKLCRQALNKDPNSMDAHQEYAEALENKVRSQVDKDPYLFNKCIQEWLVVLRGEVGDEKGLSFHGIGVPGTGHLFEDEDRSMVAKVHIKDLTGTTPRVWETDTRFMKRAGMTGTASVRAQILSRPKQESSAAPAGRSASVPNSEAH